MPCPINKTPARQAIARLTMASLVIKASSTASRGGIMDIQFASISIFILYYS
jgi:hypothetical protein